MRRLRPVLALCLGVLLALSGCGEPEPAPTPTPSRPQRPLPLRLGFEVEKMHLPGVP